MFIDVIPNRKSPPAVLLRETWREGGKIKKKTIANISDWPKEKVEQFRRVLKGETIGALSSTKAFTIERSLPHGHVTAVLGTLRKLGIERLLSRSATRERRIATALIVERLLDPDSKSAGVRRLRSETAQSTLGSLLRIGDLEKNEAYEAMDWLLLGQERIENTLAKTHLQEGGFALYDLTSVPIEGHECPLAVYGHSRDGRNDLAQIEFGLLCSREGCPVSVDVFKGNTADPTTVSTQIKKVKERFSLSRVVLVGDRGMLTSARLREDLGPEQIDWITALRAPDIQDLLIKGAWQSSMFDTQDLAEISSPDFPGERLVVCRNPLLSEERKRKREILLQSTEKKLEVIAAATKRKKNPLRGKEKIALRVGKILGKSCMVKHVLLTITSSSFAFQRDSASIEREANTDGIFIVRTSLQKEDMQPAEIVSTYKSLSRVERAFRTIKSFDIHVRPVRHYDEDRVRSHIFLCMLAYYVEWHMRRSLAPLLFQDHEPAEGEKLRASPVAPARRSPAALKKIRGDQRTDDDLPVQSFHSLLGDLGTITRNICRANIKGSAIFEKIAVPTLLQSRALSLLGVSM